MPKRLTLSIDVGSSHVKAQTVGIHGGAVTERLKLDTPDAVKRRGVELVLTLGTGLGSALYLDGTPGPRFEIMTTPGRREPIE